MVKRWSLKAAEAACHCGNYPAAREAERLAVLIDEKRTTGRIILSEKDACSIQAALEDATGAHQLACACWDDNREPNPDRETSNVRHADVGGDRVPGGLRADARDSVVGPEAAVSNSMRAMQDDVAEMLRALGLSDAAAPMSPHDVVQRQVLPAIRQLALQASRVGSLGPTVILTASSGKRCDRSSLYGHVFDGNSDTCICGQARYVYDSVKDCGTIASDD